MWRQVDGYAQSGHRLQPFASLSKAGCNNPTRHIANESRLLCDRYELIWRQTATFRVPPAHKRLDASEATGETINLRLIIQSQLSNRDGASEFADQAQP